MKNTVPAIVAAKNEAENLRKMLSDLGIQIKSTQALQRLSQIKNYPNWETYRAVLEKGNSPAVELPSYAFKHTYPNKNSELSPIIDGFEPVSLIGNKGVIKFSQDIYNGERMIESVVSITSPTDARKISQDCLNWAVAEEKRLKDLLSGKTKDEELVTIHKESNDFFLTRLGQRFWYGPVCVYFEELGEGYYGEYNPTDPNDRSLLRLNFKLYKDGKFIDLEPQTLLTKIVADQASKYVRHTILKQVMEWYIPIALNMEQVLRKLPKEAIIQEFSHMDRNWDYKVFNVNLNRRSAALAPQFAIIKPDYWGKFSEEIRWSSKPAADINKKEGFVKKI